MAIESLTQHVTYTTMNQVDEAKRELGAANQELAKDNKALTDRLSESTRDLDKAESDTTDMEGACNIMEAEKKQAVEARKAAELRLETAENEHAEVIDDKDAIISQNKIDLKAAQELSIQLEREIVQFMSDKEVDQKKNDVLQGKYDEVCREQAAFEQCTNELEQYKQDLDLCARSYAACQQELEQEQALVKSAQESDSETTDNLNKSSIRVNELEQHVKELQMSQDTDVLEELRSRTEQAQKGADTILQLRRVLKRQKKDNDRVLSIAHDQIDRQIEEIEDTKQESQSQTDLANEARLELNIHRQSLGAAQQTTNSIMQGTELVRQENNDKLLSNLNALRSAIQRHTGHTMNNIQKKKGFDTNKVCNVLQEMAAQIGKEAERVTTADNQGEEYVNIACTVEKQADAIRGIQELIFKQGDDVERVFRNDIREGISWMEAMTTAFGAPGDFQMGEVITQSAIGEQGRYMVRETAKETEADGGHRQRINDFITGLERTAACVHELAQAALKSKGSQKDNKEIADKSGSLLSEVAKTRDRVYVEETVGHRNNWFKRAAVMTILRLERDAKPVNFRRHNEQELLKLEADAEVLRAQVKSLKRTSRASQEKHTVGIKAKEEAIESMIQEQHKMSADLASKNCTIQDLETTIEGRKQELATMEKRWNDAQGKLNAVSRSTDQATHKDKLFTTQEMENSANISVTNQLSKLIHMQEVASAAEAMQVKSLQRQVDTETDRRINAESQLEVVQQDHTTTTEELTNQLEAANKDYISATEELATSHMELSESQSRHAEVEQQMMLREQETKSELSMAEEAVKTLETQLEAELEKLTGMNEALAKSQRQSEDETNANIEAQTQLKKDYKSQENALYAESWNYKRKRELERCSPSTKT